MALVLPPGQGDDHNVKAGEGDEAEGGAEDDADLEAEAGEDAGQTFAQEDVAGREHYAGADCVHTDDQGVP